MSRRVGFGEPQGSGGDGGGGGWIWAALGVVALAVALGVAFDPGGGPSGGPKFSIEEWVLGIIDELGEAAPAVVFGGVVALGAAALAIRSRGKAAARRARRAEEEARAAREAASVGGAAARAREAAHEQRLRELRAGETRPDLATRPEDAVREENNSAPGWLAAPFLLIWLIGWSAGIAFA
ncbi:MAG: hypothetical protein AAF909_15045, partial [Pseudomonadota bacterium]